MKPDRSHWTVRKVSFEEAEAADDAYYASLSMQQRLEMLMELRDMVELDDYRIQPVVTKRHLYEEEI